MKYDMGEELRDIVTGYTGVVMGRTEYLTGCTHYGLLTQTKKPLGKIPDYEWFDESRLVSTGRRLKGYNAPNTSGPEQNPPSM